MDEQRYWDYFSLIQKLLFYPSEGNEILNRHLDLLDAGFLQYCEQVAVQSQEAGKENLAGFLRNLAQEVAAFLARGGTQGNATPEEYFQFLMQVLQAISNSNGNPAVVYHLFRNNLDKLDLNLAQILTAWARDRFSKVKAEQATSITAIIFILGNLIQQFPLGRRADHMEIAIAAYELTLDVYTREAFPQDWAHTQNNLGNVYSVRIKGERADNLEQAIRYYQAVLAVLTREAFPYEWAQTQNNLGNAYRNRIKGERADNLEQAIAACELALTVLTREAFPQQWATTQDNLAGAYLYRIKGERADNLEQAISAYEFALKVRTREAFPYEWAQTQNNLGNAYRNRIKGERADNLEQAISAYEFALTVLTREAFPQQWATTQDNLAGAYLYRIKGERADNLEQAISAYEFALKVRTREAFPYEWATTQDNLGNAYSDRIKGERADNLEQAIAAYELALKVRTREAFPQQWATTQDNLAGAYVYRIKGERADNLERAIAAYELALAVYTREAFPQNWAITQNNLGNAYLYRIKGKRADNLEKAIAACELALKVLTRETFPEQWATTQNNLAGAYVYRIKGERADNLERAIAACELALAVLTREAFPEQWADIQNNLGNAYLYRIKGERAENLEQAIRYCEAILEVYTRSAYLEKWATAQHNLGNAYSVRIKGERTHNLERAIRLYQEALEVSTRASFPQEHTETLNNLGLAYQAQSQHYTHNPEKKQTALENAYATFEQALDTVELLRGEIVSEDEAKRKLNEEWAQLYRGMVEVCLELGNHTAAIEYADRSKARNLVELMATRDAYPGGVIRENIRQQLQELRQAIAAENYRLQKEKNPDRTHLNQLRQEFQEKFPYKPLHFQAMQGLLDEETAILEWYILGDKFLTFTLTPHSLKLWTYSQEDRQNLIDWGNAYLRDYRNRNNSQWRETLAQRLEELPKILHLDEILQDLFKNFPKCQKLILIPHLFLHLFPLHALPVFVGVVPPCLPRTPSGATTEEGATTGGLPLQDLFPKGVAYAPNCQLLQQAQSRPRFNFNRLFAIQNPTNDLGWADVEVEIIRTLFPHRTKLAGNNATTAKLLDEQRREILSQTHHLFFSCHAAFNPDSPLDSGLLLADGVLTLENIIAKLNLKECSLVTLSACETGQVAIDQTDEYISLSSGFILAGSPSVLVSLWSVHQVSTALLLIKTYELLQQKPGKLAQALQAAQKWLRETTVSGFEQWRQQCPLFSDDWRKTLQPIFAQMGQNQEEGINHRPYQSPYHWAAFCIVGQGEQTMVTDAKKISAFTALLEENLNNWIAHHGESLLALQQQVGDDDEKNAQAIESWLKERQDLYKQYTEKLAPPKRTLSLSGEKGGFGTQSTGNDQSLAQQIEQAVKNNTNLETSAPSPEQDREKPKS